MPDDLRGVFAAGESVSAAVALPLVSVCAPGVRTCRRRHSVEHHGHGGFYSEFL